MRISVIIFCYDEKETLRGVTESAIQFLKVFATDFEVIIVNDGSTDGSAEIANLLSSQFKAFVRVIHHPRNLGIGMALRSGYENARLEYVCGIPADGQFDIAQLGTIKPFGDNTYYSFYRRETNYSFYREQLSRLNRLYNQHFLGIYIRDVNWVKVYRLTQLQSVKPVLTSSIIESEICAKLYKCGALPVEIPSNYLNRVYGKSKGGGIRTVYRALAETWQLFRVVDKFKPLEVIG